MIYPANYPMTIEQRADFLREFVISDENGEPIDFTGYTLRAGLYTPERRRELVDFTFTWVDQAAGEFTLSLTDTQTTLLQPGRAVWDLLVIEPGGNKDYYLRGEVLIEQGYTV